MTHHEQLADLKLTIWQTINDIAPDQDAADRYAAVLSALGEAYYALAEAMAAEENAR